MNGNNRTLKERIGEQSINIQGIPMYIIEYRNSRDIDIEFVDGYRIYHTQYRHFLSGKIINNNVPSYLGVGYLGEGKYKSRENNKHTDAYIKWGSMLTRCYSEKYIGRYNYDDCFVCNEWLNFQNFAEWYYNNIYELKDERIELDKEIKYKNCRMYSPYTCLLVPHKINTIICNRANFRGKYAIGVFKGSTSNNYIAKCNLNNKGIYLGAYQTEHDAFVAYKIFKETEIKRLAETYRGIIPDNIIEYIKKYEISEYD